MESLVDIIMERLSNINWEGPAAFVIAIMALFAFFRKFSLVLLVILIVAIGWGAEDLILLNMKTKSELISLPLLIYAVGGVAIFVLAMFSFFKSD